MANVIIGGTATGATALPVASTIDAVNDYLPIYTNSATATQAINRNTLLGLASAPVGLTDTQTLTNKTLTTPTISGPTLSGTIIGTYIIGGTPTFPASVVTLTGTQTLTNKTLTSPTINSPTITNATLSADTITGYTTSNAGTIYGVSVSGGLISGTSLTSASITSTQIATNGVSAANLATNAITLGYAQITGNITTTSATPVYATGLGVAVTIPSGGRRVKVSVYVPEFQSSAVTEPIMTLYSGASVGTLTTQLQNFIGYNSAPGGALLQWVGTPSAGAISYSLGFFNATGGDTTTINAAALYPAFILVEAI